MKELHIVTFFTDGDEGANERVGDFVADFMAFNLDHCHALSLQLSPDIPEVELRNTVEPIIKAIKDAQTRKATPPPERS